VSSTPIAEETWRQAARRWALRVRYFHPLVVDIRATRPTARLPTYSGGVILDTLARLPISTWRYKWEPREVRHLGPMAQDFAAAFGLGENIRLIDPTDSIGVTMVATKALYKRVQQLEARVAELERLESDQGRDPSAG
jgi:Chaperone of endosialidase